MTLTATPGDSAADSYFTIDEADAYFSGRNNSAWTGSATAKEAAARRGTTYLDNQYRGRWKGYRTNQLQSLAWPRIGKGGDSRFRYANRDTFFVYGIIDSDGFEIGTDVVPPQVKMAAMEASLMAISGVTLEPTLARGGAVKSQSDTVGPLSTTTVWQDGAPAVDRYTVIEGLLRGLVTSTPGAMSGNVPLVRG